jgi:hypothetical protein
MNTLNRIWKSHARAFVPGMKWDSKRIARSTVSCTRSSATAGFRLSLSARAKSSGANATSAERSSD